MSPPPQRHILYIRHKRAIEIADGFRMNQDEWVEALSELAKITVISDDFDMDKICETVRPDFILYESAFLQAPALNITNPLAHPGIPRFGLFIQDPISSVRVNFLRQMEKLGIRWMFTHLAEATEAISPQLADCTFSLTLMFDDRIFYDYHLPKDIPISVMGGFLLPEVYTWRDKTAKALGNEFPTLFYTHPGYYKPVPRHKFEITGEAYARVLNRSHFSIADTTRFNYLVRKHLEIPASGSVLIAPDANVLKPYGFIDMENCILGEAAELIEKIAAVADNPDLYERIRRQGHDLVHKRYSRQSWRGILDFYECLLTLQPGETIEQDGFLGKFTSVRSTFPQKPPIAAERPDSSVSIIMKSWIKCITEEDALNDGNKDALEMPQWLAHVSDTALPIGIMFLLKGDLFQGEKYLSLPHKLRKDQSGFDEYDPEEVAWLSLTASLSGNKELLASTRNLSASMRYLSIRRMQWLGQIVAAGGVVSPPPKNVRTHTPDDQISVHWTGRLPLNQWLDIIRRILDANGQKGLISPDQSQWALS